MAYGLRKRKQKDVVIVSSGSEGEYESDPDYTRTKPRRNKNSCRSIQDMDTQKTKILFPGVDGISTGRKRRGLTQRKRADNGKKEKTTKRRKLGSRSVRGPSAFSIQKRAAEKTVLSWLMNQGEVTENDRIQYVKKKVLREGIARRDGVWCRCCNKLMTVWEFEIHAGSNLKVPYENINVIRTCKSLLNHLIHQWNKMEESDSCEFNRVGPIPGATDGNDDACQICVDGGDLICCEKCPSTFHPSCMKMESIPQGDWLCPYCACIFCDGGKGDMLTCYQCEKKYHWECFLQRQALDLNIAWLTLFCGSHCKEIHGKLHSLLGVKHNLKGGFSWTLLRRLDPFEIDDEHTRMECNSKIALAFEVLNECFTTNTDRHTGINILQSVVYNRGSNLSRLNFKGFYTLVLEKNDAIVSAATMRMHRNDLAEMPFIGTQEHYRAVKNDI
ncbi:increased DNA methylation 1 [Hevea brasiliensis]|uniref:increased DNA methylation 1 n=1 Tax=Hevea brasiliensis TaxID=3981 RepID=UPI0025DD9644|nr:increased DNA methylation 1 [Hevea brasiliensis]